MTPVGELSIQTVEVVEQEQITKEDSLRAGYESLEDLLLELQSRPTGDIYRIELGSLRADPRIELREKPVSGEELEDLLNRLQRLDSRSQSGPWTFRTLEILKMKPGVRAGDLCKMADQEKEQFKRNVRKLKKLGLTVSLGTGYRLSIQGKTLLNTKNVKGGRSDT